MIIGNNRECKIATPGVNNLLNRNNHRTVEEVRDARVNFKNQMFQNSLKKEEINKPNQDRTLNHVETVQTMRNINRDL